MLSQQLILRLNQAANNPQINQVIVYNLSTDEGLVYNRRANTLDCACPFCIGDALVRTDNHINSIPSMHLPNPFTSETPKTELEKLRNDMGKYAELLNLNLIQQLRAVCLAMEITPEEFYKNFTDFAALDEYHRKLHEVEQKANLKKPDADTSTTQGSETVTP